MEIGPQGGILIQAGDTVTVEIIFAECAGLNTVLTVSGPVSGTVSENACFDVGATLVLGPSTADGEVLFALTNPEFGAGPFIVSGQFPAYVVEMEDGFGDEDFNDAVLTVAIGRPPCPPSGDTLGVIDDQTVRDSLLAALDRSNPDSAATATVPGTNPPEMVRKEHGGVVWLRADGTMLFQELDPVVLLGTPATPCRVDLPTAETIPPPAPGDSLIAFWHTHPNKRGDRVYGCRSSSGQRAAQFPGDAGSPAIRPNPRRTGGGSIADWRAVTDGASGGRPMYIIDADGNVWRLDPNQTSQSAQRNNPNRWDWMNPSVPGCFTP